MSTENEKPKGVQEKLHGNSFKRFARSTKGSDLIIFIVCLGIASVFWLFLSLYEEVERDFDVPLEIEQIPDWPGATSSQPSSASCRGRRRC